MTHRILIIDDEDDIRQVAAMSLETVAGWDVLLASSGKQGIERASSEQPDAILLDVMMPEMDGPTTLLKLKANGSTSHIPVLLLTAKVQGPDQRKFAEMGVAATLFKPFDPLTLAKQISAALARVRGSKGTQRQHFPGRERAEPGAKAAKHDLCSLGSEPAHGGGAGCSAANSRRFAGPQPFGRGHPVERGGLCP